VLSLVIGTTRSLAVVAVIGHAFDQSLLCFDILAGSSTEISAGIVDDEAVPVPTMATFAATKNV
jgi:hypothetical protein